MCFETNFEKSAQRKENRYGSLLNDIQSTGFTCELIAIEIGSRGLVSLSWTSVLASYAIFYSKYASEWVDPRLITWFFFFLCFYKCVCKCKCISQGAAKEEWRIHVVTSILPCDTWVWNIYISYHVNVNVLILNKWSYKHISATYEIHMCYTCICTQVIHV